MPWPAFRTGEPTWFSDDLPTPMKATPKTDDGAFDMDAEWECEHCKSKVRFGDTALSWCLNIICDDCHEKERDSENDQRQATASE